jgi:ATP-dependent RNA helicase DeaD
LAKEEALAKEEIRPPSPSLRRVNNPQSIEAAAVATHKPPAPRAASKPAVEVEVPKPASKPVIPVPNPQSTVAAQISQPIEPRPAFKPKTRRVTQPFQTRLWMNVGEENGVVPIDIVNTIAGETGLPGNVVGTVDIRGRHLFVDVAAEHANAIISKLNRTQIKGHKLKVKAA